MIAIKNMKMPRNCLDCPVRNYRDEEGNRCDLTGLYNREDCCPLTEIVTCKDCKYYRVEDDDEYCTNHTIKDNKFWVREDYFCADAERRE